MKLISLLTWLTWLTVYTNAQHVIFEAVGQMVNSLNYMHCKFTLNLTSIEEQRQKFDVALAHMSQNLVKPVVRPSKFQPEMSRLIESNYDQAKDIFALYNKESIDVANRLYTLRSSLPALPSKTERLVNRRNSRSVQSVLSAIGLPFGLFGTFMGIYNRNQIRQLQSQLESQMSTTNQLIEVVQQQDGAIKLLGNAVTEIMVVFDALVHHNPSFIAAQLGRFINQMNRHLDVATHVIQQAQHRRLAVDLLLPV